MTETSSLPDSSLYFFRLLFIKTADDTKKQVSMHEIGNEAGLDKPASNNIAEELMSLGLIAKNLLAAPFPAASGLAKKAHLKRGAGFLIFPSTTHPVLSWQTTRLSAKKMHGHHRYPCRS